jgi:hypothetical protein
MTAPYRKGVQEQLQNQMELFGVKKSGYNCVYEGPKHAENIHQQNSQKRNGEKSNVNI